jgi:hypothetical protein
MRNTEITPASKREKRGASTVSGSVVMFPSKYRDRYLPRPRAGTRYGYLLAEAYGILAAAALAGSH